VLFAVTGFVVYILFVRAVERRPVTELSVSKALPEVSGGFFLGMALFAIVIATLAVSGHYRILGFGNWIALVQGLVSWFSGAIMEELLFRGFVFRVTQTAFGTWIAVAISAVLFGLVHAANPGSTVFSSIAVGLEAGVLLAIAYAVTNRLWLPIGIHTGWNYAEGTIFGTSVSGADVKSTLLHGTLTGNPLLTGGAFGVEASIVAIPVCLIAALILALKVKPYRLVEAAAR
jgi:membrane protease YdiL (CAAX protease family)